MRISIVTPSYNHGTYIEDTIRSVLNQDYDDVEHIVVDGRSSDNTVSILRKYPHLKWISEKDSGQSDAINKGFAMASGDIVAWLNSDDYYAKNIFKDVVEYFQLHSECMALYGDMTFVDKYGKELVRSTGDIINYESLIKFPDIVRQPSFFWRKDIIEEHGRLDETLKLVMDFDLLLWIGKRHRFHYIGRNFSYYRSYAENKTNSMLARQAFEMYRVFKRHGIPIDRHRTRYLLVKLLDSIGAGNVFRNALGTIRPHSGTM